MTENELVITRIFNAPREKVWKAWTDPSETMKWWGPKDFTAPVAKIDLRLGGKYLICMRGAPGPGAAVQDFWTTGTYKEIIPMEKLVHTDSFADENGNVVPATHYGMGADFPLEMEVTILLEDMGDKTKMTLKHVGLPAGDMKDMTSAGWNQSFDKLEAGLK